MAIQLAILELQILNSTVKEKGLGSCLKIGEGASIAYITGRKDSAGSMNSWRMMLALLLSIMLNVIPHPNSVLDLVYVKCCHSSTLFLAEYAVYFLQLVIGRLSADFVRCGYLILFFLGTSQEH